MDARLDKLSFNMLNMEYTELGSAWGLLGIDFRPSAFYEVRMVPVGDPLRAAAPAVTPAVRPVRASHS